MLLVVGLGNPGRDYAGHRHNVGFMVVDELARRVEAEAFRAKFSGRLSRGWLNDEAQALLFKPETYMNLSGDAVQPCAAFHKIPPSDVIVIHDELDLPFCDIRLKRGGGHGGHNGLRSLIGRMGADFARIRVGIGRPPPQWRGATEGPSGSSASNWVLSDFSAEEREKLPKCVEVAAKCVLDIAARGFDAAMKTRNTRPKKPKPKPKPEAKPEEPAADDAEATEG